MEKEIQGAFAKVHESIDKLATMVAEGFHAVEKRFEQVDARFDAMDVRFDKVELDIAELRTEVRSIRAELERLPDRIDTTYAPTFNDLLERLRVVEKKLGISAR